MARADSLPEPAVRPAAAASHPARDRYVDSVRVGSLLIVIVGHWLMADVNAAGVVGNALVSVPSLQVLTWVLQVMPLFFLVGGVGHAYALAALDRRGRTGPGRYATFVGSRAARLLRPTLVLIGVWIGVGVLARASGVVHTVDGPLMLVALRVATQPLWFVGIYLGVAALAPVMLAAHRRWGAWVVVVLILAALAVDGLRFAGGLTALATLNYAFVWLALHQLGFCWYSGLVRVRAAVALVVVGTVTLVGCVSIGPYPVSMVGLPGEKISNMSPPTVALLAQGLALAGAAVLLRQPVTRLLARPRVWAAVVATGAVTMTAFLWHLTALYLAVLGQRLLGIGRPEPATAAWWLTRPLWLLVLALLTIGLIAVFRRFDSSRPASSAMRPPREADVLTALGASLAALGVLMVSVTGIDVLGSTVVRFVVIDITPGVALATLAAGTLALALGRSIGVTPRAARRGAAAR
ncbi:MAG: acyltransferase family protein [Betaproteobacteria bacterium]